MFPATYNIGYYRGNSYEFVINPKNANGTAFDLTDYTSLFTIATARGSAATTITTASPAVSVAAGTITCTIDPAFGRNYLSAGPYIYDVEIINTSQNKVYTLLTGTISVTQDVSNTGGA